VFKPAPEIVEFKRGDSGVRNFSTDNAQPHRNDVLLNCLEFAARLLGRPIAPIAVSSHLPLPPDGSLPLHLFARAAEAAGLKAKVVERLPSKVPALLVPYIVLLKSGDAGVVVSQSGRRLKVVFPALSDVSRSISVSSLDQMASGAVIFLSLADVPNQDQSADSAPIKRHWFWSDVLSFWPAWLQIVVAASILNVLGLVFPLFVMNVYDRVIPNSALSTLWALTAGVLIALTFDFLLRQLRAVVLDRSGHRLDMRISSVLFEHSLAIKMAARTESTGALANRLREFDTVRDFFTSSSILAITDFLFIGVFIWVLLLIVGPIAYVPMAAVAVVLIGTMLIQIPLARSVAAAQGSASRRHSILIEGLGGIEAIKAVSGEGVLQRRFEMAIAAAAKSNSAVRFWSALALHFTSTVQQAAGILVVVWGVYLVADGSVSVGGLIAASLLTGRILAPLGNIAMTLAKAQQAFAAMRGISSLVKLPREEIAYSRSPQAITRGAVEFKNVDFKYPGSSTLALADVSVAIAPGERVGIIGRVGSGKSTFGKLLCGLYTVDEGTILVDGAEVRSYSPAVVRQGVGYLGQDAELLSGTLRENIVLGKPSATDSDIQEVVKLSGVEAFASPHPLGLSQPIGERGRGLSGGQKQAVALARLLLRKPRVLYLDEPSSAMDVNSEAELIRRLREGLDRNTTLFVCSHRLAFLELVDRLIVVDRGKIVADGKKEDVLQALTANQYKNISEASA
jgi:ATP-binding cassette subfamily C protein LapB